MESQFDDADAADGNGIATMSQGANDLRQNCFQTSRGGGKGDNELTLNFT